MNKQPTKAELREQLLRDTLAYLNNGGKVETVKPKPLPVQRKVTA